MTKHVDPRAALLASTKVPRAIASAVRAEGGNAGEILAELGRKFDTFKSERQTEFGKLEQTLASLRTHVDDSLKSKANAGDVVAKETVERINGAVDEMKSAVKASDDTMKAIKAEIEKLNEKTPALQAGPGGNTAGQHVDPRLANEHYPAYAKEFK